jgi:hypothetical protein
MPQPRALSLPFSRRLRPGLALVAALLLAGLPASSPARAAPLRLPGGNIDPVAVADTQYAFTNDGYQDLYVLDNDTDANGDTLQLVSVTPAAHGSVSCCAASGDFYAVAYKPFAGFSGTDSFSYTVSDGEGTDTAVVTVHVATSGTTDGSTRVAIYAGPQDRLTLTVTPKGGGPSGPATGACNNTSAGLAIQDAVLEPGNSTYYNAFDNGLTIWINGVQLPPNPTMSITHHNLASGPRSMAGFNIGLAYYGVPESFTLRTLLSLSNPGLAAKAITVTVATNVGSDNDTGVRASSSGDLLFGVEDRWIVTSDHPTNPGYIVNTHVFYGPGAVPETPTSVLGTIFNCSQFEGVTSSAGFGATFNLSVAAGATERLLFFNQFHNSNTAALTDTAMFNTTPVGGLSGLSNSQLATVVNWVIPPISRLFLPQLLR